MPPEPDFVSLSRLGANVYEESNHTFTRHRNANGREILWKRQPKALGRGSMGEVFQEKCVAGDDVGAVRAVKVIVKSQLPTTEAINYDRELEAMGRFSDIRYEEWFVRSFGWYETEKFVYIAMQLVQDGDLSQYLSRCPFPESETKCIVRQVLQGLGFMHDLGYAHRDLKPQNLLVVRTAPNWHVKIADFGLSKRVVDSITAFTTQAGTPPFIAPEVLGYLDRDSDDEEESISSYTPAVDIWAVGAIAYLLLTGTFAFPSYTENGRALKRYVKGKTRFPVENLNAKHVSSEGQATIESFMAPSPDLRPSARNGLLSTWLEGTQDAVVTYGDSPTSESSASVDWNDLIQGPSPWSTVGQGLNTANDNSRQPERRLEFDIAASLRDMTCIDCLGFTPDRSLVAFAGYLKSGQNDVYGVQIWHTTRPERSCRREFSPGSSGPVIGEKLVLSDGGEMLALVLGWSGRDNCEILLWDISKPGSSLCVRPCDRSFGPFPIRIMNSPAVAFSQQYLAITARYLNPVRRNDRDRIILYDISDIRHFVSIGEQPRSLPTRSLDTYGTPSELLFSPDGDHLLCWSKGQLEIVGVKTNKVLPFPQSASTGELHSMLFTSQYSILCTVKSHDAFAVLYYSPSSGLKTKESLVFPEGRRADASAITHNGKRMALAYSQRGSIPIELDIFSIDEGSEIRTRTVTVDETSSWVRKMIWLSDEQGILMQLETGTILLVNLFDRNQIIFESTNPTERS